MIIEISKHEKWVIEKALICLECQLKTRYDFNLSVNNENLASLTLIELNDTKELINKIITIREVATK